MLIEWHLVNSPDYVHPLTHSLPSPGALSSGPDTPWSAGSSQEPATQTGMEALPTVKVWC